jgi:hypothetical protein
MAQQEIELRKVRDFSDNLNDTFGFIRLHLKPLITSFLGIAGIFLLSAAILSGIHQSQASGNIFEQIFSGRVDENQPIDDPWQVFSSMYFLTILMAWLNYNAMMVVIISYMKLYDERNGEAAAIEEVWGEFKKHFLKVTFYTIPLLLLMVIGFIFCIIPGVYLAIVFTAFPVVLIVENETFGGAFNRCFTIIKDNFWISLGIYLVMYLIYTFSAGIISLIVGLIAGLIAYFTTKNVSATVGVVTSILNIFSFLFFIVYYVSVVLHYYNLSERYDGTGMLRKLETLGEEVSSASPDAGEEEY